MSTRHPTPESESPPEPAADPSQTSTTSWRECSVALVILLALCLLVNQCHQAPAALGSDAPDERFSAERAHEILKRLLDDERPHPIGSTANDGVRERLILELRDLGLRPVTSDDWVSNEHEPAKEREWVTGLARARNVVVELPSSNPELPAIMLACHYDSVPAGPGAGDDGAAVAALLEVARALNSKERPLSRPVILLFTDGEELGLFGAQAFSERNPLADRIGLVLNFEARGSSGGSLLFETSRDNRWIVAQAAAGLERPMSSSAYVEIYRLMPNGSDLTVFMEHDLPGMNFAFIGNPKHYHTPLDNLENLDLRSLQHHGDNALEMVRQLLIADWESASEARGDAVYTDVFARWIIAWPESWGAPIAGGLIVAHVVALFFLYRRRPWKIQRVLSTPVFWCAALVFSALLAWVGAIFLDTLGASDTGMPDAMSYDLGVHCLFGTIGIMVVLLLFRADPVLLFMTHGLCMASIALVLSRSAVAGFSYLFLLPAAASACAALLVVLAKGDRGYRFAAACLIPGLATAVAWVPLLLRAPLALGVTHLPSHLPGLEIPLAPAYAVIFALLVLPLSPLLVGLTLRSQLCFSLAIAALAAGFFYRALETPSFTRDAPQQVNLLYLEEEGLDQAKLVMQSIEGPITTSLAPGLPDLEPPAIDFAGNHLRKHHSRAVAVASTGASAPEVALLSQNTTGKTHRVRFRLRPSRESQYLMAGVPSFEKIILEGIAIENISLTIPPRDLDGFKWIRVRGASAEGVEVALTWTGPASLPLVVVGINSGLPPAFLHHSQARDALPACSAHRGDQTIVRRRHPLPE
jgi:hypothetical protein